MSAGSNFSVSPDLHRDWFHTFYSTTICSLIFLLPPFEGVTKLKVIMRRGSTYHAELAAVMDWKCARLPGNTFLFSSTTMASSCIPHFYASTRCLNPGLGKAKGHYGLFCEHSGEIDRRETSFALTSLFSSIEKTDNAFGPWTLTCFTLLIDNTDNFKQLYILYRIRTPTHIVMRPFWWLLILVLFTKHSEH